MDGKNISKAKLVQLQKQLKTDAAIAVTLGVSRETVNAWRKKLGIPTLGNKRGNTSALIPSKAKLVELQKTLRTDDAIGKELGATARTVGNWRKKLGVATNSEYRIRNPKTLTASKPAKGKDKPKELAAPKTAPVKKKAKTAATPKPQSTPTSQSTPKVPAASKTKAVSKSQFLKLRKEHGSDSAIARVLGVGQVTVWRWRQKWGIAAAVPVKK